MGTRSVVGVPNGDGFRGRYVHWDGYPEGVGEAVAEIVRRDGADTAVRMITEHHYGWSTLTGAAAPALDASSTDGRFVAVPGYGIAYTTEQGQSSPDEWIDNEDADAWCEWAYAITPTVIQVWANADDGWVRQPKHDIEIDKRGGAVMARHEQHTVRAKDLGAWTGYLLHREDGPTIHAVDASGTTVVVHTVGPVDEGCPRERLELNYMANVAVFGSVIPE